MVEFTARNLEKIVAVIGERDEKTRSELQQILNRAGVKRISAHGNLADLMAIVVKVVPDIIIVGDDLDPKVFDFIRDVRHNKIGSNPFVLISTLVAPERVDGLKQVLQSGTDDIIVKPVKDDQLIQRLRRVTMNRQAFVVTSDYLGPDRRGKNRPSNIRRINVLNTMLEKTSGKDVKPEDVQAAVDDSMNEVLHGRMDSHGYRLSFVCRLIIEAYEAKNITPDIKEKLLTLVEVLTDAARTAQRLEEAELAILCGSLTTQVAAIAGRYEKPTDGDIQLLHKINKAVVAAVKPQASPEQLEQEAQEGAQTYQQRQRNGFPGATDIQRSQGEAPIDLVDEPTIEILPLPKGQYLFHQGEPATSAYIVTSGAVAVYKEENGERIPISRVGKGEFFGEMAIVDGTARRASAFALEDTTISLVSKEMIEQKLESADPMVRAVVQMYIYSLRAIHEVYSPKSRHISDSLRDIKEQVMSMIGYLASPSAPPALVAESRDVASQLNTVATKLMSLLEKNAQIDQRSPAKPASQDLTLAATQTQTSAEQ